MTLFAQGTLVVTVQTANGVPAADAQVRVSAGAGLASDTLFAVTGANGTVVIDHVIIGNFSVRADSGNLSGPPRIARGKRAEARGRPPPGDRKHRRHCQSAQRRAGYGSTVTIGNGFRRSNRRDRQRWHFPRRQPRVRQLHARRLRRAEPPSCARQRSDRARIAKSGGADEHEVRRPRKRQRPRFESRRIERERPRRAGAQPEPRIRWLPSGDNDERRRVLFGGRHPGWQLHRQRRESRTLQLRGEATGTIQQDGSSPTIDILLQSNLINLPVTKWDANNFTFDLQPDGSVLYGSGNVFTGVYAGKTWGGAELDVINGGVSTRFTGANIGTVEEKTREVVVHQDDVGGVSVTRKVFVPAWLFRAIPGDRLESVTVADHRGTAGHEPHPG